MSRTSAASVVRSSARTRSTIGTPCCVRSFGSGVVIALLLTSSVAAPALATQYPPACTDSIGIRDLRDPAAPCYPPGGTPPQDTIWVGIGGIVTAVDSVLSGKGFWMQLSGGGPYSGVLVFTANTIWPVQRGDSVVVRPSAIFDYQGARELVALNGSFGDNLRVVNVASGLPLPPMHEGTAADFDYSPSHASLQPWEGCLVRCTGPLRVARVNPAVGNYIAVDDAACTGGTCDSVWVDGAYLAHPYLPPPELGTLLQWIQGVVHGTSTGYRIVLRDPADQRTPARQETWGGVKARYR